MPTDSPSQGSRRHFHRGRRGHDRRGTERRGPPQQQQQQQTGAGAEPGGRGDHADVEQIMRDIRTKIAQRHGIELTDQQVQELAARRLESILDPRTIKPALLDQLRRAAGSRPETAKAADKAAAAYAFEDTTLYESPSGFVRFMRKLLHPILKLFFNPNPLIRALNIQAGLNAQALRRDAERDQRQAEWNALHYEIVQRVVSEVAKVSLEVQSLTLRVESLSTKVDFNERRVRGIEGATHQARPSGGRDREFTPQPQLPVAVPPAPEPPPPQAAETAAPETAGGDGPRRRRRRRRGRRGGPAGEVSAPGVADANAFRTPSADGEDAEEAEGRAGDVAPDAVTTEGEPIVDDRSGMTAPPYEPDTAPRSQPQMALPDDARAEPDPAPSVFEPEPERHTTDTGQASPSESTPERGPAEQ